MMKWTYYRGVDNEKILIRDNDVDSTNEYRLERYEYSSKCWVDDSDMCGIFSGDILVRVITEEEALQLIKEY